MIEEIVDGYVSERYRRFHDKLGEVKALVNGLTRPTPEHPEQYKVYSESLAQIKNMLGKFVLQYNQEEVQLRLKTKMECRAAGEDTVDAVAEKYEKLIKEKKEELSEQAKAANAQETEKLEESNRPYLRLEEKRKQLLEYSDQIMDACRLYGVTSSDITVTNETFTVSELDVLYDQYIDYMAKPGLTGNVIRSFRQRVPNTFIQGGVLLFILLLAFTPVFDFIAIAGIVYLAYIQLKAAGKVQAYTLLLGLLYNVQPLAMGFKDSVDRALLVSEEIEDEDERLEGLLDAYDKEVKQLEANVAAYEDEYNKTMQEFLAKLPKIQDIFREKQKVFEEERQALIDLITEKMEICEDAFAELKENFKPLGTEVSSSAVFNTRFRLGLKDEVIEQFVDVGLSNIVIRPCQNTLRLWHFLQVLLANAMCGVKAGNLAVYVYDPNGMGQSVVELYDKEYEDLFRFETSRLDGIIEELSKYAESNMSALKSKDINT